MVTPEGEKLHSDSGISVDTQSLQEQQQHGQAEVQPQPSRSHTQEQIGTIPFMRILKQKREIKGAKKNNLKRIFLNFLLLKLWFFFSEKGIFCTK